MIRRTFYQKLRVGRRKYVYMRLRSHSRGNAGIIPESQGVCAEKCGEGRKVGRGEVRFDTVEVNGTWRLRRETIGGGVVESRTNLTLDKIDE